MKSIKIPLAIQRFSSFADLQYDYDRINKQG